MRSACEVLRDREEAASLLVETAAAKLFALTEAWRRGGADLLIIDTPAVRKPTWPRRSGGRPVPGGGRARPISTWPPRSARWRSSSGLAEDGLIALNQCAPPRHGIEPPQVVKVFGGAAVRRLSGGALSVLRSRVGYQTAFAQMSFGDGAGRPAGSAAAEVRALFSEVWRPTASASPLAPVRTANDDLGRGLDAEAGLGAILRPFAEFAALNC